MPPPLAQPVGPRLRQPHPQFDAVVEIDDIERVDIGRRLDDAFAEAKADREIFEVAWRGYHHGVGAAIIGQRQRGLFRNDARAFAKAALNKAAIAPDLAIDWANRFPHGYSAASTTGAMRREWRACSS